MLEHECDSFKHACPSFRSSQAYTCVLQLAIRIFKTKGHPLTQREAIQKLAP